MDRLEEKAKFHLLSATMCQLSASCLTKVTQQPGEDRDISSILLVRKERRETLVLRPTREELKGYMNLYRKNLQLNSQ